VEDVVDDEMESEEAERGDVLRVECRLMSAWVLVVVLLEKITA